MARKRHVRRAVARIVAHQQQTGGAIPTADTGDYCRARAKLSEAALHDLTVEVGDEVEGRAPDALAVERPARQARRRLHVHDARHAGQPGRVSAAFVAAARRRAFPSAEPARSCRWPLPACWIWRSARTPAKKPARRRLLRDVRVASARGRAGGGPVLLFVPDDRALLQRPEVNVCARLHQRRHTDFRRGRRLGTDDHLIVWTKPAAAGVDGRGDVRRAARATGAARGSLSSRRTGSPHAGR